LLQFGFSSLRRKGRRRGDEGSRRFGPGVGELWRQREGRDGTYKRSQTLREIFVVGQLVERPWSVLVYEKRHLVLWWWKGGNLLKIEVDDALF
jgi:hypothetical protein